MSIPMDSFLHCQFTYLEYVFGGIYLLLFTFAACELNLARRKGIENTTQKLFLSIVIFETAFRVIAMVAAPSFYTTCKRGYKYTPSIWIEIGSSYPPSFFISAFSVLVYSFARVYHATVNASKPRDHAPWLVVLKVILILLNCVIHAASITFFVFWSQSIDTQEDTELDEIYQTTREVQAYITLMIALALVVLGGLLVKQYSGFKWKRSFVRVTGKKDDEISITTTNHSTPYKKTKYDRESEEHDVTPLISSSEHRHLTFSHPMVKILLTTVAVAGCFTIRAVLFVTDFDVYDRVVTRCFHYLVVEVIPLTLMLYLFHSTSTRKIEKKPEKWEHHPRGSTAELAAHRSYESVLDT